MKTQADVEEQNKRAAIRLYEEIDKQNFDTVVAMFASDARIYVSGGFDPVKPDDLKPMLPQWFIAFPDYVHCIHDVVTKGDKVAVRMTYTGTHKGDFFGAPPTGNSIKYLGIHMHTFKEGKVTESWILEDMLYLWQQLGMELKPKKET
jgi:steroid delta-isomerase-like uncharacterized protein